MIQWIKVVYRQLRNNFSYIGKRAFVWTSSLIAGFQIMGFLCEFDNVFPSDWQFITKLFVSVIVVGSIWAIMFGIISVYVLNNETVTVLDAENGHHVYVEYGDLLEESDKERIIVITANRCFDTVVDNDLISAASIHGMAVQKICSDGYESTELNVALQKDLRENRQIKPSRILTKKDKRKGNLERFPVGAIAEFKKTPMDKVLYAFLGMSAFNSDLHPETTDMEYMQALQAVIEYCNARSQRLPVYMPIIGTNGRNNKKSERELLQYMIDAFRFNRHLINTDIHVVVYSGRKNEVSIYGL